MGVAVISSSVLGMLVVAVSGFRLRAANGHGGGAERVAGSDRLGYVSLLMKKNPKILIFSVLLR